MKTLSRFLSVIVLVGVASVCSTYAIIRDAKDGGPAGYNYVYTDSDEGYIKCRDAGNETCPTTCIMAPPNHHVGVNFAMGQISIGNLLGFTTDPQLGVNIRWEATTPLGLTSLIKVWNIGTNEPPVPI